MGSAFRIGWRPEGDWTMARHESRWGLWKAIVGNAAIAAGVFLLFIGAIAAEAQSGADIAGTWQGTV
jgi:hypothetical protein